MLCKHEVAGSIPAGSTSLHAAITCQERTGAMLRLFRVGALKAGHGAIFRSHGEHEAVLLFNNPENSLF